MINPAVQATMQDVGKTDPPRGRQRPGGRKVTELKLPSIDYAALAPILIMLGVALLGVLVEAFVPRRLRHVGAARRWRCWRCSPRWSWWSSTPTTG